MNRETTTELLSREQAAAFLGIKAHTLAVWACSNRYPLPFIKVGRLVKYRRSDLEHFLASNTHHLAPA